MESEMSAQRRLFAALWGAFAVQIGGRLLDLQWHRTHPEFETAQDQVTAHWLVWLGTLLVIATAAIALRAAGSVGVERVGYRITLWSNLLYLMLAVLHFVQHLNHQEVDWTHIALAVANVAAAAGVFTVTAGRAKRPAEQELAR